MERVKNKNLFYHKFNSLNRYTYAILLPKSCSIIVNEFPRSGGTWFCKLLSAATGIKDERYIPNFSFKKKIIHGHFYYVPEYRIKNFVNLWRDPRDVIISLYYHCLFYNKIGNQRLVNRSRKLVSFKNYADIKNNLSEFIYHVADNKGLLGYKYPEFIRKFSKNQTTSLKYENLFKDPEKEVSIISRSLSIEPNIPKLLDAIDSSKIKPNLNNISIKNDQVVPFVRSGGSGKWVNYFSNSAKLTFEKYFSKEIDILGYS